MQYQFTYKDYESIFDYLKEKATELSDGQWTDFTDGDFGTIVIHLLSYWGDLLSNQLDLTASELFLDTAEERTSLMEIVKLVGYEPRHYQSAVVYENFTYNREEGGVYEPLVLPAYTQFLNNNGTLSYYNLEEVTLSDDITTVTLYEGERTTKKFYYNDIDDQGCISLGDYYIGTNTIRVNVVSGGVAGDIPRVVDVRFTTGDICFSVHTSLDGIPYIQFPVSWKSILSDPAVITVNYLITDGVGGRTGANTITRKTTSLLKNYEIDNPEASVGGYNPETVSEMKARASVFARTMYSIVTLKDFEDMGLFCDDIMQVRALDYNNSEEEFPPTIPAYKQPTPPNGVPNDAYKILIMAVPSDLGTQSIFVSHPEEPDYTYGNLTAAAKQLHEIYMERKSATLYVEYRDPVYINPWLILNVYLDEKDTRASSIAQDIVNYLKILYNRGRLAIGESVYGSVIGKEILNAFAYVDYIEVRDPEYNIEAKPYEYIDINNGYHQVFVNDKLAYVPTGLELVRLRQGAKVRVMDINDNFVIKEFEWCPEETYDGDPTYIPNSYKYKFDKATGDYPHLELMQIGVLYEEDGDVMVLTIPTPMLEFNANQEIRLTAGEHLHIYSKYYGIDDIIDYMTQDELMNIPSYDAVTYDEDEMVNTFTSMYTGVKVNYYRVEVDQTITIKKPNGVTYEWTNSGETTPSGFDEAIYCPSTIGIIELYVPTDWETTVQ